jgi:hypothetical protein
MANCRYCGQKAGLLRSEHQECRQRHDRATTMIPGFFGKMLTSQLSTDKFSELLRGTAETSYVQRDELISLSKAAITNTVDSILKDRPVAIAEAQRIIELTDTLEAAFSESFELNDKLVKTSIISELYDGRIPDPVSVVGPMPFELGRGETILWIFNHVSLFRITTDDTLGGIRIDVTEQTKEPYFGPAALESRHAPVNGSSGEAQGDLILTNRNLHFVQSEETRTRIPIARIQVLAAYREGIHVIANPDKKRAPLFVLNDAWFAANVVGRLIAMVHR